MFNRLFINKSALDRHQHAPYAKEREQYLERCAEQGYAKSTLLLIAREVLWAARKLEGRIETGITREELERVSHRWVGREHCCGQKLNKSWTAVRFVDVTRPWLRFLHAWREPVFSTRFADLIDGFSSWMEQERGFSERTIQSQREYLNQFMQWFSGKEIQFAKICIGDIDDYLADCSSRGLYRVSVRNMATTLRGFFRYAGTKGWCQDSIASAIHGPRIFKQESIPSGPSWDEIKRILATTETEIPGDIRDRAIIMLFSVYGLRASEVSGLELGDIDWKNDQISIFRSKRRAVQMFPLIPTVGNVILTYLQRVRPKSPRRELFLTLLPPVRPLSRGALYGLIRKRIQVLGISLRHRGPHSLRHACATHLLSCGLSLKEIGDHLGHRSSSATRIYAKVDLAGLRQVACFDIGGVL